MKKTLPSILFAIAIAAMGFVATGADQPEALPGDQAIEQQVSAALQMFPWQPNRLAAESLSAMGPDQFATAFIPPCNQGASCRFQGDPICGPEGFCNTFSNCCMCY